MEGKLICLCFMCICIWAYMCQGTCIKVRQKLMGISFLLPLCWSLRLNSDYQVWKQVPLPPESPRHQKLLLSLEPTSPVETPRELNFWGEGEKKKRGQGLPSTGKTVGLVGLSLRMTAQPQSPWCCAYEGRFPLLPVLLHMEVNPPLLLLLHDFLAAKHQIRED